MYRVLVLSHGSLSSGMKGTLEMFEINLERCEFIQAYIDDEDPRTKIRNFIDQEVEYKIILTDIKSGSLTRLVIEEEVLGREDVYLISGYNLAMLIGILTQTEIDINILNNVIGFSKSDIELLESKEEKNDESFF